MTVVVLVIGYFLYRVYTIVQRRRAAAKAKREAAAEDKRAKDESALPPVQLHISDRKSGYEQRIPNYMAGGSAPYIRVPAPAPATAPASAPAPAPAPVPAPAPAPSPTPRASSPPRPGLRKVKQTQEEIDDPAPSTVDEFLDTIQATQKHGAGYPVP